MTNYDFLIKDKIEDTDFDVKKIPYNSEMKYDLLKDVMAMANADIDSDRHIVLGVHLDKKTGQRNLIGIDKNDVRDSSDYQSWIREFIEPNIDLKYFPYDCDGKTFGIIEISNCVRRPYLMRKEYNHQKKYLLEGEAWIRNNSIQNRMKRNDFENIYEKRLKNKGFSGDLKLYFSDTNSDILTLRTTDEMMLPSKRAYEKITKIIDRKKEQQKITGNTLKNIFVRFDKILRWIFSFDRNYLKMSLEELEKIQDEIINQYSEADYSQIFDLMANRINITIENLGDEYIEDASIRFIFPTVGLAISNNSGNGHNTHRSPKIVLPNPWNYYLKQLSNYNVTYEYNKFEFTKGIGDIKHKMPMEIFTDPLKISLNKSLAGKTIIIKCIIYGKNLREPIDRELTLKAGEW
jgi:hypothetical protein